MTLEEAKKDFELNSKVGNLKGFPIALFFNGKIVDTSIFKNTFTNANMNYFLSHFRSFCNDLENNGYPFKTHPIEIRITSTAYKFFAFNGATLFKQSPLYFYDNSHL